MSSRSRRRAEQDRHRKQRRLLFSAIAFVVVGAFVVAVALGSRKSNDATKPQTFPVTVTGAALPAYDAGSSDPAIGRAIPELSGTNLLDGSPVKIANDGKAKVILFVAHWCPHCRKEVPLLAPDLRAHPLPANTEMYASSTGVDKAAPNYPPATWLESVQWPTPVMADSSSADAARAYGLSSYPYFVFVDTHNRVVARTSGEIPLDEFRALVQKASTAS